MAPVTPPKRTGKRGPRPEAPKAAKRAKPEAAKKSGKALDPDKDFNEPVRRAPKDERKSHNGEVGAAVRNASRKQGRLPGMEDSPIKDLEDAAIEHSDLASEVVAKRGELRDSKTRIATLMKTAGKKSYNHNGIKLKLKEGHEDVSVQVKRHDRTDSAENAEPAEADPDADPEPVDPEEIIVEEGDEEEGEAAEG